LVRNKGLKALALLLALALWFAVGGEERTEATLNVALELVNIPHNLMVTSDVPSSLQVQVSGPRSVVRKLSQSHLVHTIDLSGFKPGYHSIPLKAGSFSSLRGVTIARVQPNPLYLTLAATMTRTLPLKPVLEGSPPKGYEVTGVRLRPEQITVQGPYGELADLKFILTVPIDLSNLTASATLTTDLDLKNFHLAPKERVPILADIQIAVKRGARTISGVPVTAAPQPARLQPAQVTLTLHGPLPQLKDLKPEDLKATVDTKNLKPGRHRLKVSVQLPDDIRLQSLIPDTINAQVGKTP
jgi:YbbR domain-containing protein